MKLYISPASPFARKCRVIARELDLKLEEIAVTPRGNMEYRRINPLGKLPALALADGSVLFDSAVICEYLNNHGGGKFFPGMSIWRPTNGRWKALTLQALGDGIMEASLANVYEDRLRPAEQRSEAITANNISTINSSLDVLERAKFAADPTIGEIAVGCALGYLDFRLGDLDWKAGRPNLSAWYARFSAYPSMKATVPQ
jgi:glutathione S-transferase